MGIKTDLRIRRTLFPSALKNLPTTWGLRRIGVGDCSTSIITLKNLPTTWGLRPFKLKRIPRFSLSEKPPHHMGIKTKEPSFKEEAKQL